MNPAQPLPWSEVETPEDVARHVIGLPKQEECPDCGAREALACDWCDATRCGDCLELRGGEYLCWDCRTPKCRLQGCDRPAKVIGQSQRVAHDHKCGQHAREGE